MTIRSSVLLVAASLFITPVANAEWRHGGYNNYQPHYEHRNGIGGALLGLGAGVIIGGIITQQYAPPPRYYYPPPTYYVQPQPYYPQPGYYVQPQPYYQPY